MILTSNEIDALKIVGNPVPEGKRATTYDATVGEIISDGVKITENKFRLPSRGIVWVVSNENFKLPDNVTGLATLRTTWTHGGVLALNLGILDPNYDGPLGTALVNFGNKDFIVTKNQPFFRVLFHRHTPTTASVTAADRDDYVLQTMERSERTSSTFLNISALAQEVHEEIFQSPRWVGRVTQLGLILSLFALLVAVIAIFFPIAYGISTDAISSKIEMQQLERDLSGIKAQQATDHRVLDKIMAPRILEENSISKQNAGATKH